MDGIFVVGGILVLVIGLYILTYYLNLKIEKPADAPDVECGSCKSTTCSVKTQGFKKLEIDCEIE